MKKTLTKSSDENNNIIFSTGREGMKRDRNHPESAGVNLMNTQALANLV